MEQWATADERPGINFLEGLSEEARRPGTSPTTSPSALILPEARD